MRARKPLAPNSPMDFNCAIQASFGCLRKIEVILVSDDVTEAQAVRIGSERAPHLETAMEMACQLGPEAKVNVFPTGGIDLPLVERKVNLLVSDRSSYPHQATRRRISTPSTLPSWAGIIYTPMLPLVALGAILRGSAIFATPEPILM